MPLEVDLAPACWVYKVRGDSGDSLLNGTHRHAIGFARPCACMKDQIVGQDLQRNIRNGKTRQNARRTIEQSDKFLTFLLAKRRSDGQGMREKSIGIRPMKSVCGVLFRCGCENEMSWVHLEIGPISALFVKPCKT